MMFRGSFIAHTTEGLIWNRGASPVVMPSSLLEVLGCLHRITDHKVILRYLSLICRLMSWPCLSAITDAMG